MNGLIHKLKEVEQVSTTLYSTNEVHTIIEMLRVKYTSNDLMFNSSWYQFQ